MLNRISLIGKLIADPVFEQDGHIKIANFSVAIRDKIYDRRTDTLHETEIIIPVQVENETLVRVTERYLDRHTVVMLEGRLEIRDGKAVVILPPTRATLLVQNRFDHQIEPYKMALPAALA
jgi:single-stranded DNA-binding protein